VVPHHHLRVDPVEDRVVVRVVVRVEDQQAHINHLHFFHSPERMVLVPVVDRVVDPVVPEEDRVVPVVVPVVVPEEVVAAEAVAAEAVAAEVVVVVLQYPDTDQLQDQALGLQDTR
jgi:hypothetical protein